MKLGTTILCILVSFVSVSGDDPKVEISSTDPPLNPVEGVIIQKKNKDVQLSCTVENKPTDSDVQWTVQTKNSSVIQISTATRSFDANRWAIDKPSSTAWRLRVQNVQVSDEGTYTCKVAASSQNYFLDKRQLRVVQVPQISDLRTTNDMTKRSSDKATLECYATGRPVPLVKWTRLAGELLPNGGTELWKNILKIDVVKSEDAGIYKCTAINSAGEDERQIELTVNFKPEVYAAMPVVRQKIGYTKQLECDIKGYPQPIPENIGWMHNGKPVTSQGRFEIRNIAGASNRIKSILVIRGVRQEDFGEYRCSASNSGGSMYVSLALDSSTFPTESLAGGNAASPLSISAATIAMLTTVCFLQMLDWNH